MSRNEVAEGGPVGRSGGGEIVVSVAGGFEKDEASDEVPFLALIALSTARAIGPALAPTDQDHPQGAYAGEQGPRGGLRDRGEIIDGDR